MNNEHIFRSQLEWKKPSELIRGKEKNHTISIAGKADLYISAAKAFKGDLTLYNPEDLLLSSLTSCHMMSYLYCCQKNGLEILEYNDQSEAILKVNNDGSGKISQVILNPIVTIADLSQRDLALDLHKEAAQLCFIANSCNFEIMHHPTVVVRDL